MSDDQLSGWALIAGTGGTIITMSLHPTGRVAAAQMESMIRMLIGVHALALACLPALFLGTLGLTRRLRSSHRLAMTGLVVYTLALIATLNAAVADGLVTPNVLRQIVESGTTHPAADIWPAIAHYNFYVNQGFAQVFVAGSSIALMLWSLAAWAKRELSRPLSIYGCILGVASLAAMFSGYLPLDAHHFGAVVFGQAIWYIGAGVMLIQHNEQRAAAV